MNISFVLAVYNKLELTQDFYNNLRHVYPDAKLIISSGGSTDGTKEWLQSLNDNNLNFIHSDYKISFSENYNNGIKMVKTDKLVLVHNDMVIGKYFMENIDELLTEDTLLSYTTIEPPIFTTHTRPGKVILDMGSSFHDFNHDWFNLYVERNKNKKKLYDGGVFFMGGYKKLFEDVGYFDGFTFDPAFCEDDDFLLRTKLKRYKLKTTECAITYHFVSQTSRFSDDFKEKKMLFEINSNRNFIRKWGVPNFVFQQLEYWKIDDFQYNKIQIGLSISNSIYLFPLEPFFDKLIVSQNDFESYIEKEQKNTNYNLRDKIQMSPVNVMVYINGTLNNIDMDVISKLRLALPNYEPGLYNVGNFKVLIFESPQLPSPM